MESEHPAISPRADARANRAALLQAADELFAQRGTAVSYEEIAQHANVGRATVYRHFPHREDLLDGIVVALVEQLEGLAEALPEQAESFFMLFDRVIDVQESHLAILELLPRRSEPDAFGDALRTRIDAIFAGPLRVAQGAGLVRADISPDDVRLLMMMLSGVVRRASVRVDKQRARQLIHQMLAGER